MSVELEHKHFTPASVASAQYEEAYQEWCEHWLAHVHYHSARHAIVNSKSGHWDNLVRGVGSVISLLPFSSDHPVFVSYLGSSVMVSDWAAVSHDLFTAIHHCRMNSQGVQSSSSAESAKPSKKPR